MTDAIPSRAAERRVVKVTSVQTDELYLPTLSGCEHRRCERTGSTRNGKTTSTLRCVDCGAYQSTTKRTGRFEDTA